MTDEPTYQSMIPREKMIEIWAKIEAQGGMEVDPIYPPLETYGSREIMFIIDDAGDITDVQINE